MTPRLRGLGSIAQIFSVVAFVLMSAHLARIYEAHEAATVTQAVESGVVLESKVVLSDDGPAVPQVPFAATCDIARFPFATGTSSPVLPHQPDRLILRL